MLPRTRNSKVTYGSCACKHPHAAADQEFQPLDRGRIECARLVGDGEQPVQRAVERTPQQLLLARHVVVDRRLRDAQAAGEVLHAGAVVAALVEHLDGDGEQRRPGRNRAARAGRRSSPDLLAAAAELRDHGVAAAHRDVVDAGAAEPGAGYGLGGEHVADLGRRDEHDLGRGSHRRRPEAVAGAGKGGVGDGEHEAAVGQAVTVGHVGANLHPRDRPALLDLDQFDAEGPGRVVGGHHRVDG